MKKIVGAAALASLLAGAAFAADISFSYTGNNYFKSSKDNIRYDNDMRYDCMSFGLASEEGNMGVLVDWDIDGGKLALDEYYGWMTFAPINTRFTGGRWSSRYANRVKTDAGDLDDEDFILWNMGVLNGKVADDSGNLTEKNLALVASYTNDSLLPGVLMAKFGFVTTKWDSFSRTDKDGTYNRGNEYGFVGELAFKMDGFFDVNLAIKSFHVRDCSLGLFFSPLMVENLELTAGLSLGFDGDTTHAVDGDIGAEFGFDIRARYAITEKLSVTTAHNISSALTDANGKEWNDNRICMANQANVTYAFLENMSFGLNIQHFIADFDMAYPEGSSVIISPSLAIAPTEKTKVTIAARAMWDKIGWQHGSEEFDFTVPVIFSFNF